MKCLKSIAVFFLVLIPFLEITAQNLKPGFDKAEYK